ncbi:glutathione S-transferase family protein [Roseovarius sp. M141]|uniref:glutathione S-transferase family protein n=1 Tax=Roseovarius sp. M141 TaxID=2583806 RepID=UPI0020CF0DF9|nr:glutathione S-transferase family protein [Roseovarius sp. M141]MCQ0092613.1 glutathione S-transferase family protein [Roseovarius sp. M141]
MITLYHVPQSRSMRVLWLLNELEVEHRLVEMPFDGSLGTEEFLTRSPAGRVPALEIEGERMFESGAMVEYLCERFPERGIGRLPGAMDRMAWLVWVHFAETVTQHVAALTQQHVVLPPRDQSAAVMRIESARLRQCYDAIEARLSTPVENRDYLLTGGYSAADICVGQAIYMARHFATLDGYPELAAWFERITERQSYLDALPAEGSSRMFERDFYTSPAG